MSTFIASIKVKTSLKKKRFSVIVNNRFHVFVKETLGRVWWKWEVLIFPKAHETWFSELAA